MTSIKLSKRLQMVADFVSEGTVAADIGTDHAYVPIYLVGNKHHPSALAMDVKEGPLKRARENIKKYHLEDKISVRLSHGLSALCENEAESILIAGMGGPLMASILTEGRHLLPQVKELILQPQSELFAFRKYLQEHGFFIEKEDMVCEDGKYYPAMRVLPSRCFDHFKKENPTEPVLAVDEPWSEIELLYGRHLIESRHPVLKEYLEKERRKLHQILSTLEANGSEKTKKKREEIKKKIEQNVSCASRLA